MSQYAKVKEDETLMRDLRTGVIVVAPSELEAYRKKRADLLKERDRDREMRTLKNELSDLKSLVAQLLESLDKNS